VEKYLCAVVSLPAGVFNPYSGVKTSILFFEPLLARKSDSILFVKIENDGFSLGAQRRAIDSNDLPEAAKIIGEFRKKVLNPKKGQPVTLSASTISNLIVSKEKIAANGDYNLSGERYREGDEKKSAYSYVKLGDIARITAGNPAPQGEEYFNGGHAWFVRTSDVGKVHLSDNLVGSVDKVNNKAIIELKLELFPEGTILFPKSGASTFLNHRVILGVSSYVSSHLACILCDESKALPKYVYHLLCQVDARKITPDQAYPSLKLSEISAIKIPLPPIEVQQEIVAEIEGYQKIIDGAKQVVDNWKPHIDVDPDWPMASLDDVCSIQRGKFSHRPRNEPRFYGGKHPFIQTGDIVRANGSKITFTQTLNDEGLSISKLFRPPIVVITIAANIGDTAVLDFPACFPDSVVGLIPKSNINVHYLELIMRTRKQFLNDVAPQAAQKNINIEILKTVKIPLPPIETQRAIVAEIEAEQALVAANRELIARMERKIQAVIGRVWGDGRK